MIIKEKEWDSEFFNLSIGECRIKEFKRSELLEIVAKSREQKFDLIYLVTDSERIDPQVRGCSLVDIKVTYKRSVHLYTENDRNVSIFSPNDDYKVLISLALASGSKYSRFKIDHRFCNNEFERLYTEWIRKSANRELADEVFVYKENGKILGLVTAKLNQGSANIGLIAVDERSRGKNIGTKLLTSVNQFALQNSCKQIVVPTQKQNILACKFYEKNGFTESSVEYIYHIWLNDIK